MNVIKYAVVALAVISTSANAITQREQQQAAQRAYEASARDHNEAAAGYQRFHDAAVETRNAAREALNFLQGR
jgi:hypothetical protein